MHYKTWPENQLDHIDRNRNNNKITNLRISNNEEQNHNRKDVRGEVYSCKRGDRSRYYAIINHKRKRIYLGIFDTKEETTNARKLAEIKYWGDRDTYSRV